MNPLLFKRFLLLVVLSIAFKNAVFSQSRIGYSEYDIVHTEFPDKSFTQLKGVDGVTYITWEDDRIRCYYYFDSTAICDMCFIEFKAQGALNQYVQLYNTDFVIISDTKWKIYLQNGVIEDCELVNIKGTEYFKITRAT